MVTALLLAACGPPPISVTTIEGVQIVAMVTDPPQPAALDRMTVDVWVADGIGLGTEVLVWLCTPFNGRCLEEGPPEVDGIPLGLWTTTGAANPRMTFSTTFWPLVGATVAENVDLPEEYRDGYLVMWALACVPGYCPAIDEVEIGPLPGSEAWNQITDGLAFPQQWVEDVPLGYSSIALKAVPLWRPDQPQNPYLTSFTDETDTGPAGRNVAPSLTESTDPPPVPAPVAGYPPLQVVLDMADPDGDVPNHKSFVTSGIVTDRLEDGDPNRLNVLWSPQAADDNPSPQLFVVADDGFGGTAVWASDPGTNSEGCSQPMEVELTSPADPGDTIVVELNDMGQASISVTLDVQGAGAGPGLDIRGNLHDAASGLLLAETIDAAQLTGWDPATCKASYALDLQRVAALEGTTMCDFGGKLVNVQASVVETTVGGLENALATTTTQAFLHLDPDLPCLDD